MQIKSLAGAACVVWLGAQIAVGQEVSEVESLKRQFQQLQAQFEKQQQLQRQQLDALSRQIETLQTAKSPAPPAAPPAVPPLTAAPVAIGAPAAVPTPAVAAKPWSPTDPLRIQRGPAFLDLSLDALLAAGASTASDLNKLQPGSHDPKQRGFTLQNLETVFSGAVDPYFRGQANLVYQIDSSGASTLEVEEAYAETSSLPGNLQLRAGQFFTDFGRLNPQHPHAWSFVDLSLVNARFFGGDGLRNLGARLSWLAPTPFYSEFFLSVQNSHGDTAFSFRSEHGGALFAGRPANVGNLSSGADLLFTPRYQASFDLTDAQTLVLGASGAVGPNSSGSNTRTEILGADLFWKWKPANHSGGFPFVSWQTEAMLRRYEAGAFSNVADDTDANNAINGTELDRFGDHSVRSLARERLVDYGLYSQVAYGFRKGWIAALRGDWVDSRRADYEKLFGRDPDRAARWRISPNLTWLPSEFSKVRLQYNYDHRQLVGVDHSVWLQFEFSLGAHAAHKF